VNREQVEKAAETAVEFFLLVQSERGLGVELLLDEIQNSLAHEGYTAYGFVQRHPVLKA